MIIHSADRLGESLKVPGHAAKIGMQSTTPLTCDTWRPTFGAKNNVEMQREMRGWHSVWGSCSSAPAGAPSFRLEPVAHATG